MDCDSCSEEELLEEIVLLALKRRRRNARRKKRKYWVRPIFQRRQQQGEYHNLLQELRLADPDFHFNYLRMSKERFDFLLEKVPVIIARSKLLKCEFCAHIIGQPCTHSTFLQ